MPRMSASISSSGRGGVLQPKLSRRLLSNKVQALITESPLAILTANVERQPHLQTATEFPVRHWIEALNDSLSQ